jgi:hypothetical protein
LAEPVVEAAEVVGGLFSLFDGAAEDATVVDGLLGGAGEEAEVAGGLLDATISPAAWTMNEAWASALLPAESLTVSRMSLLPGRVRGE